MPGPTKRTRQDDHLDNHARSTTGSSSSASSSASTPTTPTPPVTRNSTANANNDVAADTVTGSAGASATAGPPRRATASSSQYTTTTSNRPILTRSAATQGPSSSSARNTGLTRSTSLLNVTTRRSGLTATSSLPGIMAAPSAGAGPSSGSSSSGASGRVGMLTRTQSTPSLVSPTQLKAATGAGGSGSAAGKGGDDGGSGGPGGRRFGKGKENIPPKKDEENEPEEGSSRKRPRMSSRASTGGRNGRGRSGSVVSVRSETSGRHSSLAPSSSASSIASWSARLPSPAPSQASSAAQTADTATSVDPLDLLRDEDDFDVDKTPTKSRPVTRSTVLPPTPPPSSPSLRDAEITERVGLMRVQSDRTEMGDDVKMGEEPKEKKTNPYKQLKAFLRLSSTPFSETATSVDQIIIGREEEKATLRSYLADRNNSDVGMYVSGPPGTGKTALVTALGRQMIESEGWTVVEIGCMGLKITDIWRRLGEELACGKSERDVKEYLKQDDTKVFIILDEVDSLMPPPPSIAPATSHLLTKLFSLPLTSPTIKLIAISNTLDLTLRARLVLPDSAQPAILPFKAYGATEMAPIVSARLASANVEGVRVDQTAVMLLTKKVEAQNGDLRMCLGVLSSAITLAEAEWIKKTSVAASSEPGKVVPMTKVAVTHILKALTSYTQQLKAAAGSGSNATSATGKKICSVQLQGKMVLVAILIFLARTRAGLNGCPAIGSGNITPPLTPGKSTSSLSADLTASSLYATYSHLLSHATSPFPPAAESDYRDLLSNLETLGLISITGSTSSAGMTRTSSGRHKSSGAANGGGKVELCVREDEVRDGLGLVDGQQKGIAEEEVKRVWEREDGKIRRVREKAAQIAEAAAAGQEQSEGYF
ncbi:hypothetical protein IAU59_005262 [Kwoniella sp. CBS 9459]